MDEPSPRFRKDLEASSTEVDGVACVDVSDPRTGTKFRFYDFEYQLALQLNGQPLAEVSAWAAAAYGADLTAAGIAEFAGRLAELGFLEAAAPAPAPAAAAPAAAAPAKPAEAVESGAAVEITDVATGETRADALDNAEAEWMSPQGAKTATFVPDFEMLSSPDRTPVAPELPILEGAERTPAPRAATPEAASAAPVTPPAAPALPPAPASFSLPGASVAVTRPSEAPTVRLPPSERGGAVVRPADVPTVPQLPSAVAIASTRPAPAPGAPPAAGGAAAGHWAQELEGTLGGPNGDAGGAAAETRNAVADGPALPPGSPARSAPTPPGAAERRQPPQPDAVVMSGFTEPGKGAGAAATPAGKRGNTPVIVAVVVLVAAAAAAAIYFASSRSGPPAPHAQRVRVFSPKPSTVYRWFSGRGVVVEDDARTLAFAAPGRVAELMPPGTEFGAGEILGRLQGSAAVETLLAHHRSRLAFYQQMRESMSAVGNAPETRQAELRLVEKQRLVSETNADLARVTLRAGEPGEVLETLVKVGAVVKPGTPVARVKGRLLHGEFALEEDELAPAAKLGFCRVEVVGLGPHASNTEPRRPGDAVADSGSADGQGGPRFIDCAAPTRAEGKLTVALPGDLGLVPGQPLRLARQRYDAVFPVPAAALGGGGGESRAVWIAGRGGAAERREVAVADVVGDEALVKDGLRVGDEVILDPPATLTAAALIEPVK
jgi:hypothetical protein